MESAHTNIVRQNLFILLTRGCLLKTYHISSTIPMWPYRFINQLGEPYRKISNEHHRQVLNLANGMVPLFS